MNGNNGSTIKNNRDIYIRPHPINKGMMFVSNLDDGFDRSVLFFATITGFLFVARDMIASSIKISPADKAIWITTSSMLVRSGKTRPVIECGRIMEETISTWTADLAATNDSFGTARVGLGLALMNATFGYLGSSKEPYRLVAEFHHHDKPTYSRSGVIPITIRPGHRKSLKQFHLSTVGYNGKPTEKCVDRPAGYTRGIKHSYGSPPMRLNQPDVQISIIHGSGLLLDSIFKSPAGLLKFE